jgi:parvulin-like peptidyl-prolyl isomerase
VRGVLRTILAAAVAPLCTWALELTDLPEVLVMVDGVPLRREELASELVPLLSRINAAGGDDELAARELRRVVDDAVCRRLLDEKLKSSGVLPSRKVAERYLAETLKNLSPLSRLKLEHELTPRLDDPEFQLKAAVHLYLVQRFTAGELEISDAEVERYYQLNQLRYRLPESWDLGVIRIDRSRRDAAEIAATARARLLQGEAFEHVAREVDPDGGGNFSADRLQALFADALNSLSPGDVSRVITAPDAFYILLLRGKVAGGMIPVADAAPYIRLELSAVKDTLALRKILMADFAAAKVVYSPLVKSSSAAPGNETSVRHLPEVSPEKR